MSKILRVCKDIVLPAELHETAAARAVEENPSNWTGITATRFWQPGRTLRISFLEGHPSVQRRVVTVAQEWTQHANLRFEFDNQPDAEIRIGFQPGASWSYVGTDALLVPSNQPTMNFGWLRRNSAEQDLRSVVLHEFGHALGLGHEHQTPATHIPWNKPVVYEYYARLPPHWNAAEVNRQVFDRYDQNRTLFSEFDPRSIMLYPIPKVFTLGGYEIAWQSALSNSDREFIQQIYPGAGYNFALPEVDEPEDRRESLEVLENPPLEAATPYIFAHTARVVGATWESVDKSPLEAATPPIVERRLDVATPEKVTLNRAFPVAVSVRLPESPTLQDADLTLVRSGDVQFVWSEDKPTLPARITIMSAECDVDGEESVPIELEKSHDSAVYYFQLIPRVTGKIGIIVKLYLENAVRGSTLAYTTVAQEAVGEVVLQTHSEFINSGNIAKQPIKILFLAANANDTTRLALGEEMRSIDLALREADYRVFDLDIHPAVRVGDLQPLFLRHEPNIVHFSGHGSAASEIMLQVDAEQSVTVPAKALRNLFKLLKGNIRCVVLNACYSANQAKAIAKEIDCVIGMSDEISDDAALNFSAAFYSTLGYGKSVKTAFEAGRNLIELQNLDEAKIPVMVRNKVDPGEVVFVQRG